MVKEIKKNHYVDTVIYSIDMIIRTLKTELRQRVDNLDMGITSEQFVVLDTICCYKNIYQQQLSDILMKDKSNTTRIIKLLEQKELIKRTVSNSNGKLVYILEATDKGKSIIKDNMPKIKNFITNIFENITDEEIETLHRLSAKFQKDLSNIKNKSYRF